MAQQINMVQQTRTETDRLADVIQVLQLGQKTGQLIVERSDNFIFEQGLITFVSGRITQVSVNQLRGADALNWLRSWRHCHFTFLVEQKPGPLGTLLQSPPLGYPAPGQVMTPLPPTSSSALLDLQQAPSTEATLAAWSVAPYPVRHIEEGIRLIEHMGLSRTHRHLFLLIDGKRTVKELIRLMAYIPGDVLKLLMDLKRAGVIQL